MALNGRCHYEILDVTKDANAEVIREAYKKLAMKWHPDKNIDNKDEADKKFKQISQAYQVLSDHDKRLRYDLRQKSADEEYYDFDNSLDDFFGLFHHIFRECSLYMDNRRHMHQFYKDGRYANRHQHGTSLCFNHASRTSTVTTTKRMINGKRWVTEKYFEDGKEIITRHENGELVSKHINGIVQPVSRK